VLAPTPDVITLWARKREKVKSNRSSIEIAIGVLSLCLLVAAVLFLQRSDHAAPTTAPTSAPQESAESTIERTLNDPQPPPSLSTTERRGWWVRHNEDMRRRQAEDNKVRETQARNFAAQMQALEFQRANQAKLDRQRAHAAHPHPADDTRSGSASASPNPFEPPPRGSSEAGVGYLHWSGDSQTEVVVISYARESPKDGRQLALWVLNGEAVVVPAGTKVWEDHVDTGWTKRSVEIAEGRATGFRGWVPMEAYSTTR
jgi:hypothetical protein